MGAAAGAARSRPNQHWSKCPADAPDHALLARLLLPGRQKIGLLWTVALGILGSVVGGVIANLIGSGDVFELNVIGFIVAVIIIASVACWQPPNAQAWPRASHADASNAEAAMPKMSTCRAAEAGQTCRGTRQH